MTKAFEGIKKGLEEALTHVRGDDKAVRVSYVPIQSLDVKALRKRLDMTQADFARTYHFSISTLRKWEQGTRQPESPTALLLHVINKHPGMVKKVASAA